MYKRFLMAALVILASALLLGCGSKENNIPATEAPLPTENIEPTDISSPSPTPTPSPTLTPSPTPTTAYVGLSIPSKYTREVKTGGGTIEKIR